MKIKKHLIRYFIVIYVFLITTTAIAFNVPAYPFSLQNYDQDFESWIDPSDPIHDDLLINTSAQKNFFKEYYRHYYDSGDDSLSPWGKKYVEKNLNNVFQTLERNIIKIKEAIQTNSKQVCYGSNFQPYSEKWIENILTNVSLQQFISKLKYKPSSRGMTVKNLLARSIPTDDPCFYNFSLAGEGYPFDNIQEASILVGTPVYIIGKTLDQQWYLVLTPHVVAWVHSGGIAKTDKEFVAKWQRNAKKSMVAITRVNTSIFNSKKQFQFNASIGAVFPGQRDDDKRINILIPVIADLEHNAKIDFVQLDDKDADIMPLKATPRNFSMLISRLLGRTYGWCDMYFYSDCASELKNLFTPFGIWFPQYSWLQAKTGRVVDKSSENMQDRLKYLIENGKKFITVVYIGGHVMLYIGNYPHPNSEFSEPVAMTYQNIWGLRPLNNSYRAVIGKSVLLPLLTTYPEDKDLVSLADKKHFKVIYLDGTDGVDLVDECYEGNDL